MSANEAKKVDAEIGKTRALLLEAALTEIRSNGFRGASLEQILAHTGLTKGAFYHHFPNKMAMGYAVVEEVLQPEVEEKAARLLDTQRHPVDTLIEVGREMFSLETDQAVVNGCPINNLVQEMSGLDEGFRIRLLKILHIWRETIERALSLGQERGSIRTDINVKNVTTLVLAAYEGSVSLAKCAQSVELLEECSRSLEDYLHSLKT